MGGIAVVKISWAGRESSGRSLPVPAGPARTRAAKRPEPAEVSHGRYPGAWGSAGSYLVGHLAGSVVAAKESSCRSVPSTMT